MPYEGKACWKQIKIRCLELTFVIPLIFLRFLLIPMIIANLLDSLALSFSRIAGFYGVDFSHGPTVSWRFQTAFDKSHNCWTAFQTMTNRSFKVVITGSSAVGKTALINRLQTGEFHPVRLFCPFNLFRTSTLPFWMKWNYQLFSRESLFSCTALIPQGKIITRPYALLVIKMQTLQWLFLIRPLLGRIWMLKNLLVKCLSYN